MPSLGTSPIDASLVAASSIGLWLVWVYFGIPVLVLLTAAFLFSTRTCRVFWLFVSGAAVGIVALMIVIALMQNTGPAFDGWIPWAANVAVSIGAIVGVLSFRLVHELLRCGRMHDAGPEN